MSIIGKSKRHNPLNRAVARTLLLAANLSPFLHLGVLTGARVPAQDEGQKCRCIQMNIACSTRLWDMLYRVFLIGV